MQEQIKVFFKLQLLLFHQKWTEFFRLNRQFLKASCCGVDRRSGSEVSNGKRAAASISGGCVRTCYLGSVRPAERLNGDVQPFDQHPAPTLVLRGQRGVDGAQLLLQGGAENTDA